MGGDSLEDTYKKDTLIALKEIERIIQNDNSDGNNDYSNSRSSSSSSSSQQQQQSELLQKFLHLEKTGLSYRYSSSGTTRNKNDEHIKNNHLLTSFNRKKSTKKNSTNAYSKLRKRREVSYLSKYQLIGIILSVLLSVFLCVFGIKSVLWIVPNVHLAIRKIFEWILPNMIPKETNLDDNIVSVVNNITASVFVNDYVNKKVPILFISKTAGDEFKKGLLNLIDGQYKHTPVAISSIEKIARERLIPSSVSITTYSAKSKLSDIRKQLKLGAKSDDRLIVLENVFNNGRMPQILKLVSSSQISLPECINIPCESANDIALFPDYNQNEVYLSYSVNGTGMNFHYHRQGWSYLLKGRVKWIVFPPNMIARGFDPVTDNLKKWMTEVYIKLRKAQRPYIINQLEGQIVYIPEGYYYATITTSNESISISQLSSFEEAGGFLSYKIDGLKRYNAGDYKGALKSFTLGSKVLYDFSLLYDQALCHEALSDYKQAEDMYKQTLKRNHRYSPAYVRLIRLYLSNKTTNDGSIRYFDAKEMLASAAAMNIVNNNNQLMEIKIEIESIDIRK